MESLLLLYLDNSLLISFLVIMIYLLQKFLKKYLSNICLYGFCIVILLGYLIPFRPFANIFFFTLTTPRVVNDAVEQLTQENSTEEGFRQTELTSQQKTNSDIDTYHNAKNNVVKTSKNIDFSLLLVVWVIGFIIVFSYHIIHHVNSLHAFSRITKPVQEEFLLRILSKNKRQLNLPGYISCQMCPAIGSPITIGLLHPTILLPNCTYSEEEWDFMLRHELIHIKRKDILFQWLLLICLSINWYNPILYVFTHLWNEYCESSCDSLVLKQASHLKRIQYSKSLLHSAMNQNQLKTSKLLLINFYGGKKSMKNRLESILETKPKKTSILAICALALILCSTTIFSFAKENNNYSKTIPTETTTGTSITTTVADSVTLFDSTENQISQKSSQLANIESPIQSDISSFIDTVRTYEGANYAYGGNTPETGFDCSGLTQYIYNQQGYSLTHSSVEQYKEATPIEQGDLQPGDLVFYANDDNVVCHVAIYLGDQQVIHASNLKVGVTISPINYRPIFSCGRILK